MGEAAGLLPNLKQHKIRILNLNWLSCYQVCGPITSLSEATRFLQGSVEAPESLEDGILPHFSQERRVSGDGCSVASRLHRGVGGRGGDPGEGYDGGRGRGREAVRAGLSSTEVK